MKTVSFAKTTPETSTCSKLQRHASQALQRPSTTSQFPSFVARWAPGVASAAVQLLAVASLAAAPSVEVVSLASFAATLQHPQPAMANTENYTITVRGDESQPEEQYFQTVPQGLSAQDQRPRGPKLSTLLDGKHGKEVQQCARKCIPTCLRGGQGAPGLGPMSVRREIMVFKDGFRSRDYCVRECVQECNLEANPPATTPPTKK